MKSIEDRDFFADIHCHPTLRAYNSPVVHGKRNHWVKTYNQSFDTAVSRWARLKTKDILKESQANFYSFAKGNVRVVFDSLYPVEKGFLNFRKMASMMVGKGNADQVLRTVTGIDPHQLRALRSSKDYFQELLSQYAFLCKGQGESPTGQFKYKLVSDFNDLEQTLIHEPDTLSVVVTIEGAHAFNCGLPGRKHKRRDLEEELSQNISIVKSWKYPPFFVNLAHHFYNELCGHTRSLKPPIYTAFNQKKGLDKGITEAGWHAIHEMLATDNGPRILIDTKHMSIKSRREYYRFVESYNRLNPSDAIPIICSHTGVNQFESMRGSKKKPDNMRKSKNSDFHNWAINLSDEEIRIIHNSGGLIGIMIDKGLLASQNILDKIKALGNPAERKEALVEIIAQNIFQIVRAIGNRSAWDVLALGTDYDGLITHVDLYPDATSLPDFRTDLIDFIQRKSYGEDLWFGYSPAEFVQKILQHNTIDFMRRHFRPQTSLVSSTQSLYSTQ